MTSRDRWTQSELDADPEAMQGSYQELEAYTQVLEAVAAVEREREAILADPARCRESPATMLALAQATEQRGANEAAERWYRAALERCDLIALADDDPLVLAIIDGLDRLEQAPPDHARLLAKEAEARTLLLLTAWAEEQITQRRAAMQAEATDTAQADRDAALRQQATAPPDQEST